MTFSNAVKAYYKWFHALGFRVADKPILDRSQKLDGGWRIVTDSGSYAVIDNKGEVLQENCIRTLCDRTKKLYPKTLDAIKREFRLHYVTKLNEVKSAASAAVDFIGLHVTRDGNDYFITEDGTTKKIHKPVLVEYEDEGVGVSILPEECKHGGNVLWSHSTNL